MKSQFTLDLNSELIVDNFAGGGGASTGIELALGRHVDHAVNHDWAALGMHRINHAQTVHHCEDVFDVDPAALTEGRPVGLGWFSPDCKHFSKAKGGKPLSKRIRGLAFVILRWAKIRPRVIYMENVEEIKTWGPLLPDGKPDKAHTGRTWRAFLAALGPGVDPGHPDLLEMLAVLGDSVTRAELVRGFGYDVQTRELRACDFGAPTIRKRLFLIARCDGAPILWPKPSHAAPEVSRKLRLPPYRTIAQCIDWHLPCHSIFLSPAAARAVKCRRPLAPATLRRIAKGVDRYVLRAKRPFLVSLTHQGGDRIESVDEPARTLTAAHRGEKAVVDCGLGIADCGTEAASTTGDTSGHSGAPADSPAPTIPSGGHHAVVAAHLTKFNTGSVGTDLGAPSPTIPAGQHHGLSVAYLAQHNAGNATNPGHPADEPCSTISNKGAQQQVVVGNLAAYYGNDKDGQAMDDPCRTVTTKERFGFCRSDAVSPGLTPAQLDGARRVAAFLRAHGVAFEGEFATVAGYVIVDIGMRMLTPRELFRAQGFPAGYVIDRAWVVDPKNGAIKETLLTKEQQIRMCGNSVCPPIVVALVRANSGDMEIGRKRERPDRINRIPAEAGA